MVGYFHVSWRTKKAAKGINLWKKRQETPAIQSNECSGNCQKGRTWVENGAADCTSCLHALQVMKATEDLCANSLKILDHWRSISTKHTHRHTQQFVFPLNLHLFQLNSFFKVWHTRALANSPYTAWHSLNFALGLSNKGSWKQGRANNLIKLGHYSECENQADREMSQMLRSGQWICKWGWDSKRLAQVHSLEFGWPHSCQSHSHTLSIWRAKNSNRSKGQRRIVLS